MEDKHDEVEDIESASDDSFIADSDDEPSNTQQEDELHIEENLTEEEIEELIAELLELESKAAEAQEALEKESLAKVENEVREELSQSLQGDDLDGAVEDEMAAYREQWEVVLDELETETANLLEQLDGAGIELPKLYKLIESEAPNVCYTEAWKQRAHWVGSQATSELTKSMVDAEEDLKTKRPVRRKHGKLLEEGASGFLQKKLGNDGSKEAVTENPDIDWSSVNKMFTDGASADCTSFGSEHWASVYLASTPQQAAALGLKFPGVDEVEEIEDIDGNCNDPFVADAIANEKEPILSEEQRKKFRKVKEEDDVNANLKLQLHLKKRRRRKKSKQGGINSQACAIEEGIRNDLDESPSLVHSSSSLSNKETYENGNCVPALIASHISKTEVLGSSEAAGGSDLHESAEPRGSKRLLESEEPSSDRKRSRTTVEECSEEADMVKDESLDTKLEEHAVLHEHINGSVAGDSLSKFHCTSCHKVAIEVHPHPLLKVIACKDCKCLLEEKMKVKDADCSGSYCGWCGQSSDLVSCKSCKILFCVTCVKRNAGQEYLSKVQASSWQCFCCSPNLLQKLTSELEHALRSGGPTELSSDSDSDSSESDSENSDSDDSLTGGKRKKKIRRILDDAELGEETKRKIAIEKERQERLKSLQEQFSTRSRMMNFTNCDGDLPAGASSEVLGDAENGYIVNVVREKGEEAVRIPPSISAKLKAHQVKGIRFMWENIIQSVREVRCGDKGLGCILAHTMGLGKTLQVIAFLYTAMRSIDLGLRTALVVTPVNVLHNWRHEFMKWRPSEVKPLRVFMLEDVSRERRAELLAKWRRKGGVFLIGYNAFRNLTFGKHVKDRHMAKEIFHALRDGPDILVCDEAHIIKNTRADTTQALKQVKCQRRIALTGSPLQNNLMEYYCMVDFVREGFLGSSHEFRNRFQNPIENGQHTNSTAEDVKIMNQRSHILYEQLKGFVQRTDMSVMKKDLPPKTVFVVTVKLSPLQRKLYKRFLVVHYEKIRKSFFAGYQALAQIWNHPGILQLTKEERNEANREDAEDSSSDENMDFNMSIGEKVRNTNDFLQGKSDDNFLRKDWWNDLLPEHTYKEIDHSGKMVLLLDILAMSSEIGDKALVFSQSIPTLDLIELYLSKLTRPRRQGKLWKKGKDWYRLDGRTESSERQKLVEKFNDPQNKRVKCTLISTRAGSLGINLHAANRVIIVDGSWNPTYDLQAIYRAWRYGQKKPVFAYRLLAHGTMEEKIYKRQVTKEGLAARVVDRQQVHRTISKEEMLHLFEFGDDENADPLTGLSQDNGQAGSQGKNCQIGNMLKNKVPLSNGSCSSDKLMESLCGKNHARWIANYHEHETLLQENEEERLSKEEQDMAWEVYKRTLEWEEVKRVPVDEPPPERKPPTAPNPAPHVPQMTRNPPQLRTMMRNSRVIRKCTNLSHLLTLRSQGTKRGCSTVCGECAQEIRWEDLDRNNRPSR